MCLNGDYKKQQEQKERTRHDTKAGCFLISLWLFGAASNVAQLLAEVDYPQRAEFSMAATFCISSDV